MGLSCIFFSRYVLIRDDVPCNERSISSLGYLFKVFIKSYISRSRHNSYVLAPCILICTSLGTIAFIFEYPRYTSLFVLKKTAIVCFFRYTLPVFSAALLPCSAHSINCDKSLNHAQLGLCTLSVNLTYSLLGSWSIKEVADFGN